MSFTCTPGQLAAHVIAKLAVSDSLSLSQLWEIAQEKTSGPLDTLQKNVVWRSIIAASDTLFSVKAGEKSLQVTSSDPLGDILLHGSELEILLVPTEECRVRYLAGTENYQTMMASLGELPFQLLVVIARHGADGILNPDLARESGQDARSLRLRLQKLERAGLIICSNVYQNKTHTTHSVHVKFARELVVGRDSSEAQEDLSLLRDVGKLRKRIMEALKVAPNNLRGFSDLCKELKLDDSRLASKFFRSVCLKLHSAGYVEKLHVELPETKQRVYAIKFIKDIPKDTEELHGYIDMNDLDKDEFDAIEDETLQSQVDMPICNRIFPIFHQIYQQVHSRELKGITSGEVLKNLLGVSEYKPYTRLFEMLPTYISNTKSLKSSKKYVDPYEDYTLTKLYDNEGKLKFYRYFATEFCQEEKPTPKPYSSKYAASKESIIQLNKKLHSTLGKTSNKALIEKKRKLVQISNESNKRDRVQRAESNELIELALDKLPKRRKTNAPKSYATDDYMHLDEPESEEEYKPVIPESEEEEPKGSVISSNDLPTFAAAREPKIRKTQAPQVYKSESSVKSMTRRQILVDIIREEGGGAFSSPSLCRKLDERMSNSTLTDHKTLARDVIHLTKKKVLELRKVNVKTGSQVLERKLLVLVNPLERPSQEKINELVSGFAEMSSKRDMKIFTRRVIQSDMKLYIETPNEKKVSSGTTKRRGKNRLQALGDEIEGGPNVKEEPSDELATSEPGDIWSNLKKSRRTRKVTTSQTNDALPSVAKRPRRNIRLDKSDATLLYRAVVISKAFSRDAINFDGIATLISDLDGKILKQKWGTLRRSYGGAGTVAKGVETFQNMIMQGIEDETITEQDLIDKDLAFFLNYWKTFDANSEFAVPDEMPLYSSYKQNLTAYDFSKSIIDSQATGLMEKIEDISMRQKESVLSQSVFGYEPLGEPVAKPLDEIRSVLKVMFLAKQEDATVSKLILEQYGEELVRRACNALLRDREISYVSLESDNKFIVGDKFHNSLILKVLTPKFFHQAFAFKDSLCSISRAGKGLIVSQGIMPGQMASLLELVSASLVQLIRIDRAFRFENYESRLIDKEQIACDIVVRCEYEDVGKIEVTPTPVPYQGPCQPIWIQLDSLVNKQLWTKIVTTLIYYVVFKPGIADLQLYNKVQAVLSVRDYYDGMKWLIDSKCIVKLVPDGYLATDRWPYIFGYLKENLY